MVFEEFGMSSST